MNKEEKHLINESGATLVIVLIMMIVLTLIGLASTFTSTFEIMLSGEKRKSTDAFYAAEGGVNIVLSKYVNFVPDRYNYNPFSDPQNQNPTHAEVKIDFDPNKIGPPKGFSSINNLYAYFWVESKGNDLTGAGHKSTTVIEQNVVRILPKDESIFEVVKE
ncbi:MAG: pilus assembly PilX N-terminal domain-containing protein [Syntrophaceae bacterium]|nr:pilus assembly PilX N-terminal domain-containing protein [Syntrophaceae bacterium]